MIPPPRVIWMYYTLHKSELQTPPHSRRQDVFSQICGNTGCQPQECILQYS